MENKHACCQPGASKPKPWYRKSSIIVTALAILFYGISFFIPALARFRVSLEGYAVKMFLPMLAGLVFGGVIDYYVPEEYISKYLTRKKKRTVLYATALGFLMSACSHGIIALSMELHKKGASGPAVISFLLASPWANLPITFLLIGFFGIHGVIIIMLALVIAFSTGVFFQWLDHRNWIEKNPHSVDVEQDFSILKDMKRRMRHFHFGMADLQGIGKGTLELADMVLLWIVLGILLASLASAFVPIYFFQQWLGPTWTGLLVTLLIATVMEVCSEGTSPLAFEIYQKTGALGNAFAFLMGGVVTDYTEIALVWRYLGKRTALWMIGVTIPQVIFWASLLNFLTR